MAKEKLSLKERLERLYPEEYDIRVRTFDILVIAGIIVSIVTAVANIIEGLELSMTLACLSGIIFSIGTAVYTKKTNDYKRPMVMVVVLVFVCLFPFMLIFNGGYRSGVPFFFVFGIVYTALLLDGKVAFTMITLESIIYAAVNVYSYYHPYHYETFSNEKLLLLDTIFCETIVSLSIAVTTYFQIKVHRKKQNELNESIKLVEEANRAKTEFLAKMSHDIRTPLNTMLGMNEMIAANTSSSNIREWVNDSNVSGKILLSMIDDMLDLTRIEAGRIEVVNYPWETREVFAEIAKAWKIQANKKGLEFTSKVDENVPEFLIGDVSVIRKIVDNLLSNSVKYTESGGFILNVYWEDQLEIVVADTGVGIPSKYIDEIYKPFERGDRDVYKEKEGSGLGLSIVKELTEAVGGTISCRSVVDEGTEFTIRLPQRKCIDKRGNKVQEDEKPEYTDPGKKQFIAPTARILVVDDNSFNRKVISGFLEPALIQIDDVESGFEALEMIDIKEYDLVLMDLRMPKMDGAETLAKIKCEYPDFDTPVIVLTADIMNGVEETLLAQGFAGFLSKPVSSAKLFGMISDFISDKMVILEAKEEATLSEAEIETYKSMLLPYGIDLAMAFEFNAGSISEFLTRAELFVDFSKQGMDVLENPESDELYYLQVHSLKSGSKGVGAYLLTKMAEAVELRKDNAFSNEINAMLISEYKRVCDGISLLMKEVKNGDRT